MTALPLQDKMSVSSAYSITPRHRTVEFGDGYIQRTPLGINQVRRQITITHEHLDEADGNIIVDFYDGLVYTGDSFTIQNNAMLRTDGKYYLQNYNVSMSSPKRRSVSATLIEVFEP